MWLLAVVVAILVVALVIEAHRLSATRDQIRAGVPVILRRDP